MVSPAVRPRVGDVPPAVLAAAVVVTAALAVGASRLGTATAQLTVGVVLGVLVVGTLLVVTALRPVTGVYVYLATLPFLAGIDRSTLLPLVRPNELVLALVLLGAAAGGLVRGLRRGFVRPAVSRVDLPLAVLLGLATVWPLASQLLRGLTPSQGDVAATLPLLKLAALYVLVRVTVRGTPQLVRVARLVVWPAAAVAVIAVLQTLQVSPVLAVLGTWWSSAADGPAALAERGTTTLGSPLATGDVLVIAAVVLVCAAARGLLGVRERVIAAVLLVAGVLATGQVTAWLSAVVAAGFLLAAFPRLRRRAGRALLPGLVLAAVAVPVVTTRLQDTAASGVPISWLTRWDNLTHFYLPALTPPAILLGVRPDSVLPAPETWRDLIYLESGYLELIWIGGLPLLLGFVWFSVAVLRTARDAADGPHGRAALAQALRVSWWTLLVVSVLDAHLTLRGTGDLLFVLLGTVAGASVVAVAPASPRPRSVVLRRGADLVVASVALVVLAVPLLAIALVVRLSGAGPVLVRQRRVGLHRRPFVLYKFRSMRVGGSDVGLRALVAAELRGEDTAVDGSTKPAGDARITRVGRVLRRTSVDELPQLLNVLRGDMTLVGPRPCLEWEAPLFPREFDARFSVLPGLTGLWQVEGRSTLGTLDMLRLDLDYVHRRGLRQDLRIVLRTVPVLVRGDGAR
ncbi:sugar transferase [Actinomycetospora chiangmaiensis]|uniref:sugar transferase n=1 Tax=Actinomycetospora chiangmaiensis TaxID=402650 RepID=UPI00035FF691|nr:sugar transferase [Actinomycetospora chiangmaiensis]